MANETITGIENLVQKYGTSTTTTAPQALGRDEFLKMLLAQIKNQDPLNPMDGSDFAAQLAQFSSLEQLHNISTGISSLGVNMLSQANLQAANLVGKTVTVSNGNTITANGQAMDLSYSLASDASAVKVFIYDSAGKLVDTLDASDKKAGSNTITWDGGVNYASGNYTFAVAAADAAGKAVTATTLTAGKVSSVSFKNNKVYLSVNGQEVAFSDVVNVQ